MVSVSLVAPAEGGEALLGIAHAVLGRVVSIVGIRNEVGSLRGTLVCHLLVIRKDLQVLVL